MAVFDGPDAVSVQPRTTSRRIDPVIVIAQHRPHADRARICATCGTQTPNTVSALGERRQLATGRHRARSTRSATFRGWLTRSPSQHDEIGIQRIDQPHHPFEARQRQITAIVQIADQGDAEAIERRGEAGQGNVGFGHIEPHRAPGQNRSLRLFNGTAIAAPARMCQELPHTRCSCAPHPDRPGRTNEMPITMPMMKEMSIRISIAVHVHDQTPQHDDFPGGVGSRAGALR